MKPWTFAVITFIAFIILWQTNQIFWAVIVLVLGELFSLSMILKKTKKGLWWVGGKVKSSAKKEFEAMDKAKPSVPNATKIAGEYFGTAGKELGKSSANEDHRYVFPNFWARLGTASKNVLDGLNKWFKK